MSKPGKAGVVLFAKDLAHMAAFYRDVAGLQRLHSEHDVVTLVSPHAELILHAIPRHIADDIVITTPPQRREDSAIKLCFPVASLSAARQRAAALGGGLDDPAAEWTWQDFRACDGVDPEGNVVQFREYAEPSTEFVSSQGAVPMNAQRSIDHRALAIRWMEDNWNHRRDEVVDELMSAEAVGRMEGGTIRGRTEFRAAREQLLTAFPDLRVTVDAVLADGDTVVMRWRLHATHTGAALGLMPTGKAVEATGSTWFRFADGQIVDGCDTWNQGALMASLRA